MRSAPTSPTPIPPSGPADGFEFDPVGGPAGIHTLRIAADDGDAEPVSHVQLLQVAEDPAPLVAVRDTDGDGAPDAAEGFADLDGASMPDFFDPFVLPFTLPAWADGRLPDQIEPPPGMMVAAGRHVLASGDLRLSVGSVPDPNASGAGLSLVLPLANILPGDAVERIHDPDSGWRGLASGPGNSLDSAVGRRGACPGPSADVWQPGLAEHAWFVRVRVSDAGPNDRNTVTDARVRLTISSRRHPDDPGDPGEPPPAAEALRPPCCWSFSRAPRGGSDSQEHAARGRIDRSPGTGKACPP